MLTSRVYASEICGTDMLHCKGHEMIGVHGVVHPQDDDAILTWHMTICM